MLHFVLLEISFRSGGGDGDSAVTAYRIVRAIAVAPVGKVGDGGP